MHFHNMYDHLEFLAQIRIVFGNLGCCRKGEYGKRWPRKTLSINKFNKKMRLF
jgi:hypothetical protein